MLLLVGLGVVLLVRYPLHLALSSPDPYLMDFNVYHAVAQRLLHGQAASLYAPTTPDSGMMVFKYAPLWAALWMPLGWLSRFQGAVLWTAGSAVALTGTLAWGLRLCRQAGLALHPLWAIVAVGLLTRPLAEEMGNGQVNALWGLLMIAGIAGTAGRRPWPAAAAFAAATLLKLPSLLFVAYFGLRRWWGLAVRMLACLLAGLCLGSWLLLPAHPLRLVGDWAQALRHSSAAYAFEIGNQSLLAWLARFLTADPYHLHVVALPRAVLPWLLAGLLAGALLVVARPWVTVARDPRRWLYDSALLMVMAALFSPSGWVATYLVLAWPLALSLQVFQSPGLGAPRRDGWSVLLTGATVVCSLFLHRSLWRAVGLTSWRGEQYLFLVFMVLPWMGILLAASLWCQRSAPSVPGERGTPSRLGSSAPHPSPAPPPRRATSGAG